MENEEKLQAYEQMHRAVTDEYNRICAKMDELKGADKVKTATYRTLFADKLRLQSFLAMYHAYGLE